MPAPHTGDRGAIPRRSTTARLNVGIRAVRKTAALEDRRFDSSRADLRAHGKRASRQSGGLEPRGASPRCPTRWARRSTADRDPDAIEVLVRLQPCPPSSSASSHNQQCSGFISRPSRCKSGGSHGRFGHAAGPPRSKRDRRREPSWEFDSPTFLHPSLGEGGPTRRASDDPARRGAVNGKPSRC